MRRLPLLGMFAATSLTWAWAIAQPATSASAPPATSSSPSTSASASTSTTPADAVKEDAREHFARGIALFAEEAWDAALVEFQLSRAMYPTRNATKNAAICLRQLHRFDEALDLFEAMVREFPDMPPEARAAVDKEIKDLQVRVGYLDLRSNVAANAVVDNRPRGAVGKPLRVSVGTHVVRVIADGHRPFETQVQVASGATVVVEAQLKPIEQGGRLRVTETSGQVADVLVDGIVVGKTPWEGTMPIGDHVVSLDGPGNLGSPPTRATIVLDGSTPLVLSLEPLDARLRIEPNPAVATVTLDDVPLGRGLWEGKLRSGTHRLKAAADGFLPLSKEVTIASGRQVLTLPLEPDPHASLAFREAQAARQAWIDRRGFTLSYELRGHGIVLYSGAQPTLHGTVRTGVSPTIGPYTFDRRDYVDDFGGGGAGGIGLRASLLYMALPDPALGRIWHGLHVGTGVDVDFGYWWTTGSVATETTTTGTPGNEETTTKYEPGVWSTGWMFNVPVTLGYRIGIGSFSGNNWTGAVIGVAYAPSFSVLLPAKAETTSGFRWRAFEVTVDIIDKPMKSKEKIAHGRFFVYGILPGDTGEMLIMTIGGGAAWY